MRVPTVGDEFGRYHLDRMVGQGGMGIVFAATDLRLNRTVALKVITGVLAESPEFRARFQAEAASLARLDSPHVIAIHDHDEVDGTPYIVTQYVDGTDLWSWIDTHGAMPARHALQLCAQLARGLADAHRVGVIHRDVKPGNVLLRGAGTPDQHAYLCDFGIARADGVEGPAPTAAGMVAGTWSYLSPDRTAGAPATPSSDIYALGCVLWACLTGREPYQGTEVQVALAHQQAPIPLLPGHGPFTDQLNAVIQRALAKDPADRFSDAAELRVDLERLATMAPTDTLAGSVATPGAVTAVRPQPGAAAPTAIPGGSAPVRRKRWPLFVAGAAALTLLVGALTWQALRADDSSGNKDGTTAVDWVTGDLDGDGNGDLLIDQARSSGDRVGLWAVPSIGIKFGSADELEFRDEAALFQGDVDGDGRPDRIWFGGILLDPTVNIAVEPGNGGEVTEQALPIDPEQFEFTNHVLLADVTDDGRDDIVIRSADSASGRVAIWVAESRGLTFAEPEAWYSATDGQQGDWIIPGDFDGDGNTELMEISQPPDNYSLHEARILTPADGTFEAGPVSEIRGNTLGLSTWLPMNVDDDPADELVIPGARGEGIVVHDVVDGKVGERQLWWRNKVAAKDYERNLFLFGQESWTYADLDGDGDDDLVHVSSSAHDDDSFPLNAYLAEDGAFVGPTAWGDFSCGSVCEDQFEVVPPVYTLH